MAENVPLSDRLFDTVDQLRLIILLGHTTLQSLPYDTLLVLPTAMDVAVPGGSKNRISTHPDNFSDGHYIDVARPMTESGTIHARATGVLREVFWGLQEIGLTNCTVRQAHAAPYLDAMSPNLLRATATMQDVTTLASQVLAYTFMGGNGLGGSHRRAA